MPVISNKRARKSASIRPILIDSQGKVYMISDAGKVLEEMVGAGLKPTLVTFSALICAYAKGGKRDERRSRHLIVWLCQVSNLIA